MKLKPKVLLIEDDDSQAELYTRRLTLSGCDVRRLKSPIGATNEARRFAPDVVVIDHDLPGFPGEKLVPLLQQSGCEARTLLYSAESIELLAGYAVRSGADAWLSKSVPLDDFADRVQQLARD